MLESVVNMTVELQKERLEKEKEQLRVEKVEERLEKEKEQLRVEKVEERLEKVKERLEKEKEQLRVEKVEGEKARLEGDLLRAEGLLTSRSVYERIVQLAFNEQVAQNHARGRCVVSNALPTIALHPDAGRWSKQLVQSAERCAGENQTSQEVLESAWISMCEHVHNPAWGMVVVPKGDRISPATPCIARELCEMLGLNVIELS